MAGRISGGLCSRRPGGPVGILLCQFHAALGHLSHVLDFLVGHEPRNAAGRADHHHPIGDVEIWGQQGASGNDALAPDARSREKHGTHSDQSSASDELAVHECGVPDGHIVLDDAFDVGVAVYDGVVLDVDLLADEDPGDVAADDDVKPEAGEPSDRHVAGDDGVVSAIRSVGEFGHQLHIPECIVRRVAAPQNPGGEVEG